MKPNFKLLDKVKKAEDSLFGVWIPPSSALREVISLIPLTKNSKTLVLGPPGTGKSALIAGICIIYSGSPENIAEVKCDPSLTPDDVLYRLDLAKLVKGEAEEVYPRDIVTRPIKWFNEITRASPVLQDALLGLLAERKVVYRDKVFTSPDFIALADYNPADMGGQDLSWPVADRFDISIEIGSLQLLDRVKLTLQKYQGRHVKDLREIYTPVLTFEELKEVWEDVEKVAVPRSISVFAEILFEEISGCIYDRNRISTMYTQNCRPNGCHFYNELCSKILRPASYRATDALVSLCKARAWRQRRDAITTDDLLFLMPYVLAHRIKVKPDFLVPYNEHVTLFLQREIEQVVKVKQNLWKEAIVLYGRAMESKSDEERYEATRKLKNLADRDISITSLYGILEEAYRSVVEEALKIAEKEGYTKGDIEKIQKYVELTNGSRWREYQTRLLEMKKKLTIMVGIETYREKVVPAVAKVEPSLATKLNSSCEGTRFKIEVGQHGATIMAKDSKAAEEVLKAVQGGGNDGGSKGRNTD